MRVKISVLMGIYNCATTLPEAIDSILSQTETDWELILCDDGSADETYRIAQRYQQQYPQKIILLRNAENRGLNHTLNRCLEKARGTYIARMDGDDLSLPTRFEAECSILDSHPELAIVSCPMIYFDEAGDWGRGTMKSFPDKMDFLRGTPFCHAPCMVRAEAFAAVGGYAEDPALLRVEDYDLWTRMYALGYRGMNLDSHLYKMRDDRNAVKRRKFRYRVNEFLARARAVKRLQLPLWGYLTALRPILIGLLPEFVYRALHRMRLR